MGLHWVACEMSTGRVIADLPDLRVSSALRQTIGRYETATVELPVVTAPDDWARATLEGFAQLVALDDSSGQETIPWGGYVSSHKRVAAADSGAVAELSLVTMEGYFDRRVVGDETYTGTEQCAIVQDLAQSYAADSIPLQFNVTGGSTLRDRAYADMDDKTLYSALTDLMGVQGGPEWTISWVRLDSPTRYVPVLNVADRLGSAVPAGMAGPGAQFSMPGSVISVELVRDFSAGAGANDVVATAASQNDVRPQSPHQVGVADGRPKFEYRWQPSSSITDVDTLTAHAQRALAAMQSGSVAVTLTSRRSDAVGAVVPRLGVDWLIGDDIGYDITHSAFPEGLVGVGRAVGWEIDVEADTVAPILLEAS